MIDEYDPDSIGDIIAEATDQFNELMQRCRDLDKAYYQLAAGQAKAIKEALIDSDSTEAIIIAVSGSMYVLTIQHMDVLNEVYCMLEILQHLEESLQSLNGGSK